VTLYIRKKKKKKKRKKKENKDEISTEEGQEGKIMGK
jgi:uncharacterized protein YuzE